MKFPRQTIGMIVLGGIIFLGISCAKHEPQPIYNGRPLSDWVKDLNYKRPEEVQNTAKQAIRQIGTNSLPFLANEMITLGKLWEQMGAANFWNSDELMDRTLGMRNAFKALGPIAKPAVPELVHLLNSATNGANTVAAYALTQIDPQTAVIALTQALTNEFIGARLSAANELYEMRSNADIAVPNLIKCLNDNSPDKEASSALRGFSADALGFIGSDPEKAIPALIEALRQDKDIRIRITAARSLAKFGKSARLAIPVLMQASTNDADSHVRFAATNALKEIKAQFP